MNYSSVSIIIPSYNSQNWIDEAIQSCIKQTYTPLEIIIVDDGSTDNSVNMIKNYVKNYQNLIKFISHKRKGVNIRSLKKESFEENLTRFKVFNILPELKQYLASAWAIYVQVNNIEQYDLRVPAITLNTILNKHKLIKVDLLSLDVEGYEVEVLKGIDFDKYKPGGC